MLVPKENGEYQIPESAKAEFIPVPAQPEMIEASSADAVAQYVTQHYDSLVRGTPQYEKRTELLVKDAELENDRQNIVALGNDLQALRQAVIENRLKSKTSVMQRAVRMITTGPFDSTVDKPRLIDDAFRSLMNEESSIGSSLIEVPAAVGRQEFFLSPSHPNEWYYHAQSLRNPNESVTIRYMVLVSDLETGKSGGVVKSINGGAYENVTDDELTRLTTLTKNYADQVMTKDSYELAA